VVDVTNRSVPVFDATMHVRTLHLIEDPTTKDGRPVDQEALTSAFLASPELRDMASCFAQLLAEHALEDDEKRQRQKKDATAKQGGHHSKDAHHHHHSSFYSSSFSSLKDRDSPGSGGGGRQQQPKKLVRVYLATDSADLRAAFASLLVAATEEILNGGGSSSSSADEGRHHHYHSSAAAASSSSSSSLEKEKEEGEWEVAVDYFAASLPPAHYMAWTRQMDDMVEEDWRGLTGTTAEWLFLGRGHRMYTAKGVRGGERARPSSFSMSAAAFGGTPLVTQLVTAQQPTTEKGAATVAAATPSSPRPMPQCKWRDVASF
jgi:hypothetical protein